MFAPSNKTLIQLCNCLYALGGWFSLLEEFGLASHAEWVEMMTIGEPEYEASFDSWDSLRNHLESGRGDPEKLRHLCGALFRYKETYASRAEAKEKFLDALAGLEVQLLSDGYRFDGFEVVGSRRVPSVAQLADEALESALCSQQMPLSDKILECLERARAHLAEDRHNECLTHLRLALKYTLEGIAKKRAASRGEELHSEREGAVRDYLKSIGFLTEEEWRGFQGIYGLLSVGPHGDANRNVSLLGYAACVMACYYAINKFQICPQT